VTTLLLIALWTGLFACTVALAMTIANLRFYAKPIDEPLDPASAPSLTVCVPARNEEANLEPCVRALLASNYPRLEVLVYDDASTDATPEILAKLCTEDARVRAAETVPLPDGWNGKQHACDRMGRQASGEWLLFTDADVRFEPACLERAIAEALRPRPTDTPGSKPVALVSTFPRQITGTLGEALVVPMIFFILLSYLPLARMRSTTDPGASAGCGQFLCVLKTAWLEAGGHAAFRDSMHDGIKLPRNLRRLGYRTDLFDATDLCACRMYHGFTATWRGFAKNAFEGLGSVGLLTFITVMHLCGHVLPWVVLPIALLGLAGIIPALPTLALVLSALCVAGALVQRAMLAARFKQSPVSVALHPVGVALMTLIQWHSLYLAKTGKRTWRGRTQGATHAPQTNPNPNPGPDASPSA